MRVHHLRVLTQMRMQRMSTVRKAHGAGRYFAFVAYWRLAAGVATSALLTAPCVTNKSAQRAVASREESRGNEYDGHRPTHRTRK
jgi:hypothetical protein